MSAGSTRAIKQFGQAVRGLREQANLTQAELAEKSGLQPNFLGEIERAEKLASLETIAKIADGLGLTVEKLMSRAKL